MGADPATSLFAQYDIGTPQVTNDVTDSSVESLFGQYGFGTDTGNIPAYTDLSGLVGTLYNNDNSSYLPSTYAGSGSLLPVDLTGNSSGVAGSSAIPFGGTIYTTSTAAAPRTASSTNLIWLILLAVGGFYLFESRRKK